MAAFILGWRYLPADRPAAAQRPRFDHLGTLLLAVSLGAYALAMTPGHGDFSWINGSLILVAVVLGGFFIRTEGRVASPLIQLAAFRDLLLRMSLGMNILVAAVMMTTLVVGPFYLSRVLGLSEALVGAASFPRS